MKLEDLRAAYKQFFDTEAGKHLFNKLNEMITQLHKQAEDNAEVSRDLVQQSKGIRTIQNHIVSVINSSRSKP